MQLTKQIEIKQKLYASSSLERKNVTMENSVLFKPNYHNIHAVIFIVSFGCGENDFIAFFVRAMSDLDRDIRYSFRHM